MFDVIYSLALEDTKEAVQHRESLDAALDNASNSSGRPNRETWGRTPAQQRAMKSAAYA